MFKSFYKQKDILSKKKVHVRKSYLSFFENPSQENVEKHKSKENYLKFFKNYVLKSMNFTKIGDLQESVVVKQVQKGLFKNFYKQKNFLNKKL